MSKFTPPPEHDPSPHHRRAVRDVLDGTESCRRRTPILAAAAVAAIVATGVIVPQLRSDGSGAGGPAGGSDPSTRTLAAGKSATPQPRVVKQTTTTDARIPEQTKNPPKDPVRICKDTVAESGVNRGAPVPAPGADVVLRLDGKWGVTLILSDGKLWVGCDTAHYTYGGEASILEPSKLLAPAANDGGSFAVSNLALQEPRKPKYDPKAPIFGHYWAAGLLPKGVSRISYLFPDGVTKDATVSGRFWLVEHLETQPIPRGQNVNEKDRIKVVLHRADGSVLRTHRLKWGDQTCAHINHGC